MNGIENIGIQDGQKVLNKLARANVCYGKEGRAANYKEGKGTIIGFDKSPLVGKFASKVVEILMKDKDLIVEGNQYDDVARMVLVLMAILRGYVYLV